MTDTTTSQMAADPVVAAVDGSAESYRACARAAVDAALRHVPLHLVTSCAGQLTWEPEATRTLAEDPSLVYNAHQIVAEAAGIALTAVGADPVAIETDVVTTPVIPYLIEQSGHACGVVVGSRGLGVIHRSLLGSSVSTAMVLESKCPVTVVHKATATDPVAAELPVLVGVDGGPTSVPALEFAFEEASRRKVGLTALHTWTHFGRGDPAPEHMGMAKVAAAAVLAESLANWTDRYPDVPVRRILDHDRPARALLQESEHAQLVVIGSHGRGGFTQMLMGSTVTTLVPSVECPITVVRSQH